MVSWSTNGAFTEGVKYIIEGGVVSGGGGVGGAGSKNSSSLPPQLTRKIAVKPTAMRIKLKLNIENHYLTYRIHTTYYQYR